MICEMRHGDDDIRGPRYSSEGLLGDIKLFTIVPINSVGTVHGCLLLTVLRQGKPNFLTRTLIK